MLNCVTWGHCAVCGCPLCFVNAFYGWPPLTVFVVDRKTKWESKTIRFKGTMALPSSSLEAVVGSR
jgi:hypothetical protein